MHMNLFVVVSELDLLRVDQHADVLPFDVVVTILGRAFNVDPQDLLVGIIDVAKEAHIKGVRAEELRHLQMRFSNPINGFDLTFHDEVHITAGVHLNVVAFQIVVTTKDEVMSLNLTARLFESFCRVLVEVLSTCDGHGEHEVIFVLSDLHGFRVVTFFQECADDRNLRPL